jgi:hypothetical protein
MKWQEKILESVIDPGSTKGKKPVVKKGDPFAKLPPKLKAIAMARKALQGGGTKELGRLGSK